MAIIDFPIKGNAMGIEDARVEQRCSIQGREMSCPHIPIIRVLMSRDKCAKPLQERPYNALALRDGRMCVPTTFDGS